MCLENDPDEVKKILKGRRKKFTVYKRLNYGLESPYFFRYVYKEGENVSNSRSKGPNLKLMVINKGLHVVRNMEVFNRRHFSGNYVVEFTAYKKDLIGANESLMVFRKLYLSKKNARKYKGV